MSYEERKRGGALPTGLLEALNDIKVRAELTKAPVHCTSPAVQNLACRVQHLGILNKLQHQQ